MNARQAIVKLRQLTGHQIAYREDPRALDAEGRKEQRSRATELHAKKVAAKDRLDELRAELLKDPRYVAARDEWAAARDAHTAAIARGYRCKLTVGKKGSLGFFVLFEGDNWEDIVAQALAKKRSEQE